ncbi:hypothetical protein [Mycolicibacter algericus]|nr:hypothetical protein [Mycolicibacter algericus]
MQSAAQGRLDAGLVEPVEVAVVGRMREHPLRPGIVEHRRR